MQPYQAASEEIRKQGEAPLNIAKTTGKAAVAAGSAYLAGGSINRVLPFLSKYIPENLVKMGLSKIDPRYGKFIDTALQEGKSIDEVKDFIGQKIQESPDSKALEQKPEQQQQQQKKGNGKQNLIATHYPELHKFLENEVAAGRPPMEALSKAKPKHEASIAKLEKQLGAIGLKLPDLIEDLYGQYGLASSSPQLAQGNPSQQAQQPQQGNPQAKQQLLQAMQALSGKLRS